MKNIFDKNWKKPAMSDRLMKNDRILVRVYSPACLVAAVAYCNGLAILIYNSLTIGHQPVPARAYLVVRYKR